MSEGNFLKWSNCLIYIIISACVIFVILTYYKLIQRQWLNFSFIRRTRMNARNLNEHEEAAQYQSGQSIGLVSSIIHSLPAVQYKESIRKGCNNNSITDCAVCLTEFAEGDWLRLLPNCAHVFHVLCIDAWFRSHSTCPLCRMNVLYDFTSPSPGSSASGVALLTSLRREDPCEERPLGHRLFDSLTMQNSEFRLGAMSSHIESDSEDSFPAVSPLMGGTNNRTAVENLVKLAHSYKEESSCCYE